MSSSFNLETLLPPSIYATYLGLLRWCPRLPQYLVFKCATYRWFNLLLIVLGVKPIGLLDCSDCSLVSWLGLEYRLVRCRWDSLDDGGEGNWGIIVVKPGHDDWLDYMEFAFGCESDELYHYLLGVGLGFKLDIVWCAELFD